MLVPIMNQARAAHANRAVWRASRCYPITWSGTRVTRSPTSPSVQGPPAQELELVCTQGPLCHPLGADDYWIGMGLVKLAVCMYVILLRQCRGWCQVLTLDTIGGGPRPGFAAVERAWCLAEDARPSALGSAPGGGRNHFVDHGSDTRVRCVAGLCRGGVEAVSRWGRHRNRAGGPRKRTPNRAAGDEPLATRSHGANSCKDSTRSVPANWQREIPDTATATSASAPARRPRTNRRRRC